MKDIGVDLRAARRQLDSMASSHMSSVALPAATAPAKPRNAGRNSILASAAVLVVAVAVGIWLWQGRRTTPAASPSGRPAIAVLYFDNNTGDPSLDWIRTGLTDMMVTDLSQTPNIEVLGTDRLYQILQEL